MLPKIGFGDYVESAAMGRPSKDRTAEDAPIVVFAKYALFTASFESYLVQESNQ